MYSAIFPYVLGLLLAVVTCYPATALSPRHEKVFFTAIITVVALGFIGFPLQRFDGRGIAYEAVGMILVLALAGVGYRRPRLLFAAFFVHGCWDLAYLLGFVPVDKPGWVVQLCVPYDWAVAVYLARRAGRWGAVAAPATD